MSNEPLPPPETPPTTSPATTTSSLPTGEHLLGIISAAVALISAFLPWLEVQTAFGTIAADGIDGDGQITAICAVIGLVAIWKADNWLIGAAICGTIIGGVGLWHYYTDRDEFEIGIGLYGTIAGGIGLVAISLTMLDKQRRERLNYPA